MGYSTSFRGEIAVEPRLNAAEREYLYRFSRTRHVLRRSDPYFVDPKPDMDAMWPDPDIIDNNEHGQTQPNLWCCWQPNEDGDAIEWNGMNHFYDAPEWMRYLLDHFIGSDPIAKRQSPCQFDFLQGHQCYGMLEAQGDDDDDRWLLVVSGNTVARWPIA
jgi:hypothetical protein